MRPARCARMALRGAVALTRLCSVARVCCCSACPTAARGVRQAAGRSVRHWKTRAGEPSWYMVLGTLQHRSARFGNEGRGGDSVALASGTRANGLAGRTNQSRRTRHVVSALNPCQKSDLRPPLGRSRLATTGALRCHQQLSLDSNQLNTGTKRTRDHVCIFARCLRAGRTTPAVEARWQCTSDTPRRPAEDDHSANKWSAD
jgi:hypothetical protein